MSVLDIEQLRKQFEEDYAAAQMPAESDWFRLDADGDYRYRETDSAWEGYQLAAKRITRLQPAPIPVQAGEQSPEPQPCCICGEATTHCVADEPFCDEHLQEFRSFQLEKYGAAIKAGGQGEPEEIDPGALYAVRVDSPYTTGLTYWTIGKNHGVGWMNRDDGSWVGPVRGVVEYHKLIDPERSILGHIPEDGAGGQGGEDGK
jgi:hypothetical protein